ncbi:MAG: flagellar hook-basal body protein [Firmicutes bacterium]|nr:flagellar hook-basal body protein [Bacillota bacterium]
MMIGLHQIDVAANNLANADTAGYRRADTVQRAFPELLMHRIEKQSSGPGTSVSAVPIGGLGLGATIDGTYTDFSAGSLRTTDNPLDLALLEPNMFFTIDTDQGVRYTRSGAFALNPNGTVVTSNGDHVLGQRGPIRIQGNSLVIDDDGVVYVDDQAVDRLLVTTFNDPERLERDAAQYFAAAPEAGAVLANGFTVLQGHLERSNVNVVQELVKMINLHRAYEANQRSVKAADETLGKLVNELTI